MDLSALNAAVLAVCPAVTCLSIGVIEDRSTWRLAFGTDATDDQRQAAQHIVDTWADPLPSPEPVPDISDRQFGRGLWGDKVITFDECEAFVSTGVIPAALQKLIDALPDDNTGTPTPRKEAIIFVRGAKIYERDNAFVDELGQAFGWSPAQIDDKWRAWSDL